MNIKATIFDIFYFHVSHGAVVLTSALGLEILLKYVMRGSLFSPVTDHAAGGLHYLPCLALLVDLAQARPEEIALRFVPEW